jgi:carboxylate-amine ligase
MTRQDAQELGCVAELEQTLEIPKQGTSAHRQIRTYTNARASGASHNEALRDVVDMLIDETARGL